VRPQVRPVAPTAAVTSRTGRRFNVEPSDEHGRGP
jgi:hypothetical protein